MKNLKYLLLVLPVILLSACSADEGTEPGSNPDPTVTLFHYTPDSDKGLNPDNDVTVRFATNSATKAVYYMVDLEKDMNTFINDNGIDAYMQKIIAEGEKIEVNGADNVDKDITGIKGECVVVAVATNGATHSISSFSFVGLDWVTLASGYFQYGIQALPTGNYCELQKCMNVENSYRIKDAFPGGMNMLFTTTEQTGADENGNYTIISVPENETPWTTTSGPLYVSDIDTWTGEQQYYSLMYDDNYCQFALAWYVSAQAYLGLGYGFFLPN